MKPPKPTGFNVDTPPEIYIRDLPEPEEEPEDDTFEIKNPFLANLFHYGMIGIILTILFSIAGAFIAFHYLRRGGDNVSTLVISFVLGGGFGIIKIVQWIKSKDFDKDDSGL